MPPPQGTEKPPQFIVFWIIWFAIFSGLLMIQFFIGGGVPSGTDQGGNPMPYQVLALSLAAVSLIIRFAVIPRIGALEKKLPAMIVGLALAEASGILGIFVVPPELGATRVFMLVVAVVCIVLHAPVYAKASGGNPFVGGAP